MTWRIDEPVDDFGPDTPPGPVTSLRQVLATLRRTLRIWVSIVVVGLLLGIGWAITVPAPEKASLTLLLAHPAGVDPESAMATDVSILRTRAMAEQLIEEGGLSLTPTELQAAITAVPATSTVLDLTVEAIGEGQALKIAEALSRQYLSFRADQISAQARALEQGYQQRIDTLQKQAQSLTRQYGRLSEGTPDERAQAGDILTLRSQVISQVTTLQQSIEESEIGTTSVINASHVLDPARVLAAKPGLRLALSAASGMIGGAGIGVLAVIVPTLLSTRLRRRDDIAAALGTSVAYAVPRVRGRPAVDRGRTVLASGIRAAFPPPDESGARLSLAVANVDEAPWAPDVVAEAATGLAAEGRKVLVVDLSGKGGVAQAVDRARARGAEADPLVFRPEGAYPALARGPLGKGTVLDEPAREAWQEADIVLVLAPLELDAGIDELASWVTDVVILVTAGRTTAERLRSIGELVRTAGLELRGALLTGTHRTDDTLGRRETPGRPEARRASS